MYVPIGEHGTLSINSTTREEFDATDRQLAETLAANAHVALERLDRRAERRRRERAIEELHRMTPELTRAESKQAVAEMITTAVRDALGHSETGVRLLTEDGTRLEPVAMSSASKAKLGDRPTYCVGEGTAGEAFQAQETLVYDDLSTVDDEYDRGGSRAGLYVPIEDHGTITVAADQVGAFDDEDIKLTEILAANAAAALDRVDRLTELERQNERLDEFATIVSHDLRNPLNVATGQLKLAQTDPDPDRIEQALSALGRVESLLSDLLTYAREGRDIGDRTAVGLAEVAQRAWATATTGDATVQVETTRTVHADRTRLRQVLENLFSNSVEHGGPDVTVTVGATDDGFYVADDGPGIPAAERENVFDGGYTTGDAGSGLGLAIVADIVRAHGWTITVTDSEAGGARFDVTGTER